MTCGIIAECHKMLLVEFLSKALSDNRGMHSFTLTQLQGASERVGIRRRISGLLSLKTGEHALDSEAILNLYNSKHSCFSGAVSLITTAGTFSSSCVQLGLKAQDSLYSDRAENICLFVQLQAVAIRKSTIAPEIPQSQPSTRRLGIVELIMLFK